MMSTLSQDRPQPKVQKKINSFQNLLIDVANIQYTYISGGKKKSISEGKKIINFKIVRQEIAILM